MPDDRRPSRRPWVLLALLTLAFVLAVRAGVFDARRTRRLLEPPTRAEMDQAAARDSARRARAAQAPAFTPIDPPVTFGQMVLWFALPVAGTVLLVFLTARRGR
jgi:hypothetical protein